MAEHLTAVVPRHPHRSNLPGPLVNVEIGRTVHAAATISQVNSALCIASKLRDEFVSHVDHLVGLFTYAGHLSRQLDVLAVAIRSAKGIARQKSGWGLLPSHNHPGIEPPGQRYGDRLRTIEVPREILREDISEFPIVGLRVQGSLVFSQSSVWK